MKSRLEGNSSPIQMNFSSNQARQPTLSAPRKRNAVEISTATSPISNRIPNQTENERIPSRTMNMSTFFSKKMKTTGYPITPSKQKPVTPASPSQLQPNQTSHNSALSISNNSMFDGIE